MAPRLGKRAARLQELVTERLQAYAAGGYRDHGLMADAQRLLMRALLADERR